MDRYTTTRTIDMDGDDRVLRNLVDDGHDELPLYIRSIDDIDSDHHHDPEEHAALMGNDFLDDEDDFSTDDDDDNEDFFFNHFDNDDSECY